MKKYLIKLIVLSFILFTGCNGQVASPQYPKLLTPTAENITFVHHAEGQFCIYNGEKYGFMNENGEEITPYIHDYAYPFSEGLALVCLEEKYGFIDGEGEEKLAMIYDQAAPFSEGLAYVELGEQYGFIDQAGKIKFLLDCDSVSSFKEKRAYFSIDGKYGYLDETGKIIIDPVYDEVGYFQDGLARVRVGPDLGVIDINGKIIVPIKYEQISIEEGFLVMISNGRYGCINREGAVILEAEYDTLLVRDGFLEFSLDHQYGLADEKGSIITARTYQSIAVLPKFNAIIVASDDKYGILDFAGKVKLPLLYERIDYDENSGIAATSLNDQVQLLNLSDFSFSDPWPADRKIRLMQGYAVAESEGKYGVLDRNGKLIIPFIYEDVIVFDAQRLALKKEGRYYLADFKENMLSAYGYDHMIKVGKCFQVELNHHYGMLNENGEEIVLPSFDYISTNYVYQHGVYRQASDSLAHQYQPEMKSSIILTDDDAEADLFSILLQNMITPRNKLFHDFIYAGEINDRLDIREVEGVTGAIKRFKLYDLDGSGHLILSCLVEPVIPSGHALSCSGFYTIKDNQVEELITGYECGGSLGGDIVGLFFDQETSTIVLGAYNHAGGFGGIAWGEDLYRFEKGEITPLHSYLTISQTSRNIAESVLFAQAHLFYDEDGHHYIEGSMKAVFDAAGYVTEYLVDDQQTTIEAFGKVKERFRQISFD